MSRIRTALADARALLVRAASPFRPAPGTTEGAVMLGLVMIAGAFLIRGYPELALGVPGSLLVAIGLGFTLRRGGPH